MTNEQNDILTSYSDQTADNGEINTYIAEHEHPTPKTITRHCKTIPAAVRYQNRLYDRYNNVKLTRSPMFTDYGVYQWTVSSPILKESK